jgi:Ca2+-transporting ATPase
MKAFYKLTPRQTIEALCSDERAGLPREEAARRLASEGPNELEAGERRPLLYRFLDQFKDLLIVVLIVAAMLAFYLGDFRGGTILLVIVLVNAVIGFYQEHKAERILESLNRIIRSKAVVTRDGQRMELDQAELVPGDLVYLEEGSAVPADIRLTSTTYFSTNDFVLTGESEPQEKSADLVLDEDAKLADRHNQVFMGMTVAKGNASGVVVATGMNTAIGQIARQTETIEHDLSPLQREINVLAASLTKIAGVIALTLFALNFVLNVGDSDDLRLTIELSILFAISVAAACVPQGLPAQITVALSLGVGRLAGENAVVKKLSSVETLGSTTIICSDKTGTLTQNEMTITEAATLERLGPEGPVFRRLAVSGRGYAPEGEIELDGHAMSAEEFEQLKQFFEDGFLASNGRVLPPDDDHRDWYAVGDPSEAAFTTLLMKAGMQPDDLEKRFPDVREIPFDSVRKRMTIVREHNGQVIGYMKGAIESVLTICSKLKLAGDIVPLTDELRQEIIEASAGYSRESLRVIALAFRDFPDSGPDEDGGSLETDFVFAGFVAMLDPPREGVGESIAAAYGGGIRIVMLTGDNEITARAIAERIGMQDGESGLQVIGGDELQGYSDNDLKQILEARSVIFSRVSPEDKLRIVRLLKEMEEIVAVTGDGVNDTLSLKRADIGVAMGRAGSEVAKEAAEIILLDDNFRTLTTAVMEGRTIFANLKKTILASITSNNGELTCVLLGFIGMAMGLPAPITAVQILAIDLVGEMLPLTAITFDPTDRQVMNRPPRDMKDHIINRNSLINLIFYGFWMGAAGYFSFVMVYTCGTGTLEAGHAAAYTGIIFCQFMNILSRRVDGTIFSRYLFTNPQLWGSFVISIVAISILLYVPQVSIWFGFAALSASDLVYPVAGAVFFLFLHEAGKFLGFARPNPPALQPEHM